MFNPKPSINKQDANLKQAGAYNDIKKIKAIKSKMYSIAILIFVIGLATFFPLHVLLFGGVPFADKLIYIKMFYSDFFVAFTPHNGVSPGQWVEVYWGWYFQSLFASLTPGAQNTIALWKAIPVLGPWLTLSIWPTTLIAQKTEGLNSTPNIYGDTRWAIEKDIERMSKNDLIGSDGDLFLVGKLHEKFLRMKETLSVLLLAPPGTGKTVAFIVPSTVMMDKSCQLLNDQKPELFHMTSGHRSTLGPVFQLMWSAQDAPDGTYLEPEQAKLIAPELICMKDDGTPETNPNGAIKTKPVFYPSWNPIGPKSIPTAGPRRDLYIERLVSVLCPDPQGGGDKFWTSKARTALIGLIHFLVAKIELGQDDDYEGITEAGIPKYWLGKEASFPMFVDWFTNAQNSVDDSDGDDPIREMFRRCIKEAEDMDEIFSKKNGFYILNRAKAELTQLMNQPDKTRGSILTTLDEALNPFKNEAVRQRTSSSSFSFTELRGSPKPEARAREEKKQLEYKKKGEVYMPRYARDEWEPITIYISVNAEDAKAFATITGIFVDSANSYLVANGPNAIDDRGNQLGPHDFFFLLDETPTLPKLNTVTEGPAVGRSKRVSYCIVGQDFAQIESRYSKPEVETLKSTTAIKVILSQNNETAAKSISSMAGSMTYKKAHYGKKPYGDPITKFFDWKKEIISSEQYEKREFIDPAFVMSMPEGKHIVLVQNFMNRPILADTPRFFLEKDILDKVYNLRTGKGPKPTLPMPASYMQQAAKNEKKAQVIKEEQAEIDVAKKENELAIIVSPNNTSELSLDFNTGVPAVPPGSKWVASRISCSEFEKFYPIPEDEHIAITEDPRTLHSIVSGRKVYIFSDEDFNDMNEMFKQAGLKPIPTDLKIEVQNTMIEIDDQLDHENADFCSVGYYGTTRCDRTADMSLITPIYAFDWMMRLVNNIHGYEHEVNRASSDI